jgi:hypothetical protein
VLRHGPELPAITLTWEGRKFCVMLLQKSYRPGVPEVVSP